jgi:hypothetical protein
MDRDKVAGELVRIARGLVSDECVAQGPREFDKVAMKKAVREARVALKFAANALKEAERTGYYQDVYGFLESAGNDLAKSRRKINDIYWQEG